MDIKYRIFDIQIRKIPKPDFSGFGSGLSSEFFGLLGIGT